MSNAVREGARYGSVLPLRVDASGSPDPENMKYRVKHEASSFTLGDANIQVFYEQANVNPPTSYAAGGVGASTYAVTGNEVRIQATTRYTPLTPFAALLFPSGSVTLSGTAVMRIE